MAVGIGLLYVAGGLLRLCLMNTSLAKTVADRAEVSTPLNAWHRVKEGIFLYNQGIPVYSGGVYHGTPIGLFLMNLIIGSPKQYQQLLFVMCDVITAVLLAAVASAYSRRLLKKQKEDVTKYAADTESLLLRAEALNEGVVYVGAAYLFCPYILASCISMASTVFDNLVIAATLLALVTGHPKIFGALLSVAAYQSFYPICLLLPGAREFYVLQGGWRGVLKMSMAFVTVLAGLLYMSSEVEGGWAFLQAIYGFILVAPDLTPNIGLFWYFFTEMFEHFRPFFLATFQINAFVYVLPLSTHLKEDPVLLSVALLALSSVFRSYPSLGDVGLYLSMLPMWKHLYFYFRQTFLVGCMLVATSVLGPIMYNLWIFSGSANANFYFAVTLAFNTAQIFLVTDLLFAHVKRQYHLYHGSIMELDGKPATLTLE